MKKSVLLALVLVCVSSISSVRADEASRRYIDNFGKIWRISKFPCLDRKTVCVQGARDIQHALKCGDLSIRGTEVTSRRSRVITMTVFPNEGTCKASAWIADTDLAGDSYRGIVTDANGKDVEFTLVPDSDGMNVRVTREDPSNPGQAVAPARSSSGNRF